MNPILRIDGEEGATRLADLDEDVRLGRVPHDADLRWPPWTGDAALPLDEVPELADALDAPGARLARRLRTAGTPWVSIVLSTMVALAAAGQTALWIAAGTDDAAHQALSLWLGRGAVGLVPSVLDGGWWTAVSSQLTHSDTHPWAHALANLPLIAYCGYRVEKAVGPAGVLAVAALSSMVGAALVVPLSPVPVVGSSIVAYGLWAAQITIGFKHGEVIPEGWKGRYGWGNFKFFAPLYAMNLYASDVSHLAHLGGLLGGVVAILALRHATTAPAAEARAQQGIVLAAAAAALLLPMVALAGLQRAPGVAAGPWTDHAVEDQGLVLRLPQRMADAPIQAWGLAGWRADPNEDAAMFLELRVLREAEDLPDESVRQWWAGRTREAVDPAEAPAPLGEGWRTMAFTIAPERADRMRLVEHRLRRGRWVVRAGHTTPAADAGAVRRALFDDILSTVVISEPPELAAERDKYERNPGHPATTWDYAAALQKAGALDEADALLANLTQREDGWAWDAARARLRLLAREPALSAQADPTWLDRFLESAPPADTTVHVWGTRWLVGIDRCDDAHAHITRLREGAGDETARETELLAALDEAVAGCPAL
jgi:rhomboid protease GluP